MWGLGLGAAVTAGWLRIAGDKHYFTDVLTGALVGSAIGFGMPYLLHRRGGSAVAGERRAGVSASWSAAGTPLIGWSGSF